MDEYIAGFPPETQAVLTELRRTIHAAVPGAVESISYQMPRISVGGRHLVHFAGWKAHVALYPMPVLDSELEPQIAPYRSTKDTVRFPLGQPVPYELVGRVMAYLVRTRASD